MINKFVSNGDISYHMNLSKNGDISKDMFKIEYNNEIHYLVCTFKGAKIIHCMLIS